MNTQHWSVGSNRDVLSTPRTYEDSETLKITFFIPNLLTFIFGFERLYVLTALRCKFKDLIFGRQPRLAGQANVIKLSPLVVSPFWTYNSRRIKSQRVSERRMELCVAGSSPSKRCREAQTLNRSSLTLAVFPNTKSWALKKPSQAASHRPAVTSLCRACYISTYRAGLKVLFYGGSVCGLLAP